MFYSDRVGGYRLEPILHLGRPADSLENRWDGFRFGDNTDMDLYGVSSLQKKSFRRYTHRTASGQLTNIV
jgi:hypothetical protein